MAERENVRFNVLRNALYHTTRRRYFERWNRAFTFMVILLGTSAAADLGGKEGASASLIGLAVAAVGTLQLVFDFGRAARDHQGLQRDYYGLLAEIERTPEPDEAQCANWQAQMITISGNEPPTLRAVDAKAFNDAMSAIGTYGSEDHLFIPWTHRLLGWFWAYDGYFYQSHKERQEKAATASAAQLGTT